MAEVGLEFTVPIVRVSGSKAVVRRIEHSPELSRTTVFYKIVDSNGVEIDAIAREFTGAAHVRLYAGQQTAALSELALEPGKAGTVR